MAGRRFLGLVQKGVRTERSVTPEMKSEIRPACGREDSNEFADHRASRTGDERH
jgi:hypothetical protein